MDTKWIDEEEYLRRLYVIARQFDRDNVLRNIELRQNDLKERKKYLEKMLEKRKRTVKVHGRDVVVGSEEYDKYMEGNL